MLVFVGIFLFALYVPLIIQVARSSEEERRMRARFAALRGNRANSLAAEREADLLKSADRRGADILQRAMLFVVRRFELETLLLQANSKWSPQMILYVSLAVAMGAGLPVFAGGHGLFGATLAACAIVTPVALLKFRARRRTAAFTQVLPEVSDMISRALRAGHSISASLGVVAEEAAEPARSAFSEVFQKQKFGLPLRDALLEMVRCLPSEDLKVLVTAVLVQRDSGGNLVHVLERTSAVIRERQKLAGDVRVHTAQGRMTGWILCSLPVLMLGVLAVTNPTYPRVLFDDPLGRKLLYAGLSLLALGVFLIQHIVKGIEI